ncbi:Rad4-domain-containing protein [Aspergillus heteromorphus CBS 117.55]|uniref:Rad4-domain-containing protein n=1 Tax=Aspergillus heteromorphus CBS 117.55 TaxID=1448321 RepID=A0A317VA59_9EURO|nr:Rad4-domain-containing protein [Aspergillus heteromorphus CBS 117.55]PWY69762.1 Rad4-domain-containing protein [Aspergillus heteromorphus CBS 117.55]
MASRTPSTRSRRNLAATHPQRRRHNDPAEEIPAVYQEMLAEVQSREPPGSENERPLKKRRAATRKPTHDPQPISEEVASAAEESSSEARHVQTVYDSLTSSSEESDMEWEEVDIQQPSYNDQTDNSTIQVTLDGHLDPKRNVVPRRRAITAAERRMRLDIHKVHLLCLLRHVQIRNLWCNDEELQGFLKKMLPKQIISLIHPPENKPQYTRSTSFIDGLNQASDIFNRRFRITKPGLKRPFWADNPQSLKQRAESIITDAEVFLSRQDFCEQAKIMQGSRDFGAQLFCALLRSVAIEARLVCSLQPLPFSGTTKNTIPSTPTAHDAPILPDSPKGPVPGQTNTAPRSNTRRLGRPQFGAPRRAETPTSRPHNSIRESSYPVFWVEALNEATQKWIPVDPLVTKSLAKSFKFEPPSSDSYNLMSYVVAFEDDASARDVTRRYTKAFNAKTRKFRIESIKNGPNWWNKALYFYEKPFLEDRDQLEISELTSKTASEPMPRNIQDFKNHPIYAIERHLRRNEVVFPKRVIGQVGTGKTGSKNQALEAVYRRSDVHALRSADKWYRLGRDLKTGEQPLKRVPSRKPQAGGFDDYEQGEDVAETPLYAFFQTRIYEPPPVVGGKVPKNVYGNLDVYVPSMVPPGGVHITHPDAAHAARILAIDYSAAVTGFSFKGRHGTAVFQGVVIATEYREALEEVLDCLESEKLQAKLEKKSAEALQAWKHFLLRLRIAERVKGYMVEGEHVSDEASPDISTKDYEDSSEAGGGFIPEPGQGTISPPATLDIKNSRQGYMDIETSASVAEDEFGGGGFIPEESEHQTPLPHPTEWPKPEHRIRPAEPQQYTLVVVPTTEKSSQTSSTQGIEPGYANQDPGPISPQVENRAEDASINEDDAPTILESHPPPTAPNPHTSSPESNSQKSYHSDEASLLSQDPEDEDAIPDWLM